MKHSLKLLAAIAVITIFSCNKSRDENIIPDVLQKEPVSNSKDVKGKQGIPDQRKIIKEGDLSFETKDAAKTRNMIATAVSEVNGYISKDDAHEYAARFERHLTIRIPANEFDNLLDKISKNVTKFDNMHVDVLDVTAEYIDIEARLKTKKELKERYREILSRAAKVDEILYIEKEIGSLQSDIESVEGQMKLLKDKISYSTLDITYYQKTFAFYGFMSKSGDAIKIGWNFFLTFIIAIIHVWPFVLLFIVLYFFLNRQRKKKKLVRIES